MVKNRIKTAGELSLELNESTDKYELYDIAPEFFKDLKKKLENTIQDGIKSYSSDFYVVIESKRERLMQNVARNYIFHRISCPAPHYDQTVYRYNRDLDDVECLWAIPEKSSVKKIMANPIEYYSRSPEMTQTVLDFMDGTLLKTLYMLDNRDNKEIHG